MDKLIDPNVVANAYSNSSNVASKKISGDDDVSFSDFLKAKTQDKIDAMRSGEVMSAKAVTGEADLTDVVLAVNAAELALDTVVAIRDRLVSAYQDIMRMPI